MSRVTFYVRSKGETTFTTDPAQVATAFLDHRLGRKVRDGGPDVQRYLDRFLSDYLRLAGAEWARYGDDDPNRTRHAFDTVRRTVRTRLDDLGQDH